MFGFVIFSIASLAQQIFANFSMPKRVLEPTVAAVASEARQNTGRSIGGDNTGRRSIGDLVL